MDIQALASFMALMGKQSRADYQMTIGGAIIALDKLPQDKRIAYSDGKAPREAMSYRGYYSDLAFDDQDAATVGEVLAQLEKIHNTELEGYKGGEYMMGDDTPIWRSEYGSASSIAWMDFVDTPDAVLIVTKQID